MKMIYGTAWKKERTCELVKKAIYFGFRSIDTACQPVHYNEKGVGDALTQISIPRTDLFIQTKFSPYQTPETCPFNLSLPWPIQVETSLSISLKNLQTTYVDSLLLHSPITPMSDLLSVWSAMEKSVIKGEVKQIGISNCYNVTILQHLYEKVNIKPSIIQNRFYVDTNYDVKLRKWCKEKNIQYQSFWTLTANPQLIRSSIVYNIAKELNKTPEQIWFLFLIQGQGIVPLTGTTNEFHMKQDLEVLDCSLCMNQLNMLGTLLPVLE